MTTWRARTCEWCGEKRFKPCQTKEDIERMAPEHESCKEILEGFDKDEEE